MLITTNNITLRVGLDPTTPGKETRALTNESRTNNTLRAKHIICMCFPPGEAAKKLHLRCNSYMIFNISPKKRIFYILKNIFIYSYIARNLIYYTYQERERASNIRSLPELEWSHISEVYLHFIGMGSAPKASTLPFIRYHILVL